MGAGISSEIFSPRCCPQHENRPPHSKEGGLLSHANRSQFHLLANVDLRNAHQEIRVGKWH